MEWFLERRNKSVARNAQLAVKNMHSILEKQNLRVRELEGCVVGLQHLATDSLELEIHRLELRRKDLLLELDTTEAALQERKKRLEDVKLNVKKLLAAKAPPPPTETIKSKVTTEEDFSVPGKKNAQSVTSKITPEIPLESDGGNRRHGLEDSRHHHGKDTGNMSVRSSICSSTADDDIEEGNFFLLGNLIQLKLYICY